MSFLVTAADLHPLRGPRRTLAGTATNAGTRVGSLGLPRSSVNEPPGVEPGHHALFLLDIDGVIGKLDITG
jgi:hypothetical protein